MKKYIEGLSLEKPFNSDTAISWQLVEPIQGQLIYCKYDNKLYLAVIIKHEKNDRITTYVFLII